MNNEVSHLVEKYHLGGVILFAENVVDTEQTVKLTHEFQKHHQTFLYSFPLIKKEESSQGYKGNTFPRKYVDWCL